jgi:hypothetical protein
MAAQAPHLPAVCQRSGRPWYNYKSWSATFRCPVCGRERRQNLNFLGQRQLLCNGMAWQYQAAR